MTIPRVVCHECDDDLEHCHDVLVLHLDGTTECVDSDCESGFDGHEWVVSCIELQWSCYCSRVGHSQPLAA